MLSGVPARVVRARRQGHGPRRAPPIRRPDSRAFGATPARRTASGPPISGSNRWAATARRSAFTGSLSASDRVLDNRSRQQRARRPGRAGGLIARPLRSSAPPGPRQRRTTGRPRRRPGSQGGRRPARRPTAPPARSGTGGPPRCPHQPGQRRQDEARSGREQQEAGSRNRGPLGPTPRFGSPPANSRRSATGRVVAVRNSARLAGSTGSAGRATPASIASSVNTWSAISLHSPAQRGPHSGCCSSVQAAAGPGSPE